MKYCFLIFKCKKRDQNVNFIQVLMQLTIPQLKGRLAKKNLLSIKTKNLNFKADNESTSESPVKSRLRKSSLNLKSFDNIDLRKEISIKEGFEDCYQLEQKVGEGGHSVVYKCRDLKTKNHYAVKVTRKNDSEKLQNLKQQYRILASLNHVGILKGHFLFLNEKKSICHLVCQYYDYPNLREYIVTHKNQPVNENKISRIIKLVLNALFYLHDQKVSHRDLKPQNILYDEITNQIKIIDFQVAKMSRYTHEKLQMWTKAGTPTYRSPQLLKGSYNELTDMWSLGIITYEMLAGKFPFNISYERNLYNEITNFVPNFANVEISDIAKNFLSRLLKHEPKQRMTAKQSLSHPFILSVQVSFSSKKNHQKLNSSFDNQKSWQNLGEQVQCPKSRFYDESTKLTFLQNIDKDIGIRLCEQ